MRTERTDWEDLRENSEYDKYITQHPALEYTYAEQVDYNASQDSMETL